MAKQNATTEMTKVIRQITDHRTGKSDAVVKIERGEGMVRVSVIRNDRDRVASDPLVTK